MRYEVKKDWTKSGKKITMKKEIKKKDKIRVKEKLDATND